MVQFSNFLRNLTIHLCMFSYLVTCFLRVAVPLLCRSQGRTISPGFTNQMGINRNTCIFDTACNRHSHNNVTLKKHVTKYKSMRKWMVEFFKKIQNRSIKISGVNSILLTKSTNLPLFTLILYGFGVRCVRKRFSVLGPFMH